MLTDEFIIYSYDVREEENHYTLDLLYDHKKDIYTPRLSGEIILDRANEIKKELQHLLDNAKHYHEMLNIMEQIGRYRVQDYIYAREDY
jgi:hypothetical protein